MSNIFLVLVGAVLVIGYQLYQRISQRAAMERFVGAVEDGILSLREVAGAPIRRRPPPSDEASARRHAEQLAGVTGELESLRCTVLGDLEELRADGSAVGVTRWFVDRDGTTCGWCGMLTSKSGPMPVIVLLSEFSPPRFLLSRRGGTDMAIARPPALRVQVHDAGVSLRAVLDAHRAAMSELSPAVPQPVADLAGAVATFDNLRTHSQGWRAAQDAEALDALDVEAVLAHREGEYEAIGYTVFSRLCARRAG